MEGIKKLRFAACAGTALPVPLSTVWSSVWGCSFYSLLGKVALLECVESTLSLLELDVLMVSLFPPEFNRIP